MCSVVRDLCLAARVQRLSFPKRLALRLALRFALRLALRLCFVLSRCSRQADVFSFLRCRNVKIVLPPSRFRQSLGPNEAVLSSPVYSNYYECVRHNVYTVYNYEMLIIFCCNTLNITAIK